MPHLSYRRRKRAHQHEEAHSDQEVEQAPPIEHPDVPTTPTRMVVTAAELDEVVKEIRGSGLVAYDTEFIGEETYHPRICLIQLATTEMVAIVDPFVVENLDPMWEVLADPDVTTLVHAGHVDLMMIRRAIGVDPRNVVDTQVAAAFAGLPWPVGLARLIESYTGRRLGKGHTFTNWDARPLSRQQLRYAIDDVRYLPMLWAMLRADLEERGTLDWAITESEARLVCGDEFDPEPQARRASKGMNLKPRAQALLRALVVERDRMAREANRPHRVVLPDGALLELVRRRPGCREDLAALRGLPRPTAERWHESLLELVGRADSLELPPRRSNSVSSESAFDQVSVDALWSIICTRLLAMGIAPGMLVSRAALADWFLNERKTGKKLFSDDDWRCHALGGWIEDFITGRRHLSIGWGEKGALVRESEASAEG